MYSYDRPAYNFWQGFYETLIKRGLTHEQALEELSSTGTRHFLDQEDVQIKRLGSELAEIYVPVCVAASNDGRTWK